MAKTSSKSSEPKEPKFLQVGKVVRIHRSQVVDDELNPRFITEANAKRLKKSISKNGLVGHLVWNAHTGHIVGGHQRLAAIDSIQRTKDYNLDVLQVDLPEKDEIRMNVVLNNQDNQGQFDFGQLQRLAEEYSLDVAEDFGFSEEVIDIEFPEIQQVEEKPIVSREASPEDIAAMKEKKKEGREKYKDNQEEFGNWHTEAKGVLTVVFEKESEKKAWLKRHGMAEDTNVCHVYDIEEALLGHIETYSENAESSNENQQES